MGGGEKVKVPGSAPPCRCFLASLSFVGSDLRAFALNSLYTSLRVLHKVPKLLPLSFALHISFFLSFISGLSTLWAYSFEVKQTDAWMGWAVQKKRVRV